MDYNNLLNILANIQSKLISNNKEKLTLDDIKEFFELDVTPEFNITIHHILEKKIASPDDVITQAILKSKNKEYLITIALCLKHHSDPNLYIDLLKIGKIHILGYVYYIFNKYKYSENVLNTAVLMLIAKGSRITSPIFEKGTSTTVIQWLEQQGYETILKNFKIGDPSEIQSKLDQESSVMLSILLDMPLLLGRSYLPKDIYLAIRAISNKTLEKLVERTLVPDTKVLLDYKTLDSTVTYLNSYAYRKLISYGQFPSYILINKILINMRKYYKKGYINIYQELEKILLESLSFGVQIDHEQFNIIKSISKDLVGKVIKEYKQPYWRKICKVNSNNVEPPEKLEQLALSLNIKPNSSMTYICKNIKELSAADKEALKQAHKKRQQTSISSKLGHTNEFIGDKIPKLVCHNRSLLPHDPLEYNDVDLLYYRDENNTVWCFDSETFETLLETGINPYNNALLPEYFKKEIKERLELLRDLKKNRTTFSKALEALDSEDVISNETSEAMLNRFGNLAAKHSVSLEDIKNVSKKKIIESIESLGYNLNLDPLTKNHVVITISYALVYIYKKSPDIIEKFFELVKSP